MECLLSLELRLRNVVFHRLNPYSNGMLTILIKRSALNAQLRSSKSLF